MKKILTICLIALFALTTLSLPSAVDARTIRIRSYVKKSGKYVPSHYRTSANHSRFDNWSTKGNRNPFTGKKGYKKIK